MTLAKAPNGESVTIDVLNTLFFSDRQYKRSQAPELVVAGRELLQELKFERRQRSEDYQLCQMVEVCLAGEDAYGVARAVCENLKRAAVEYRTYGFDHDKLLKTLFKIQPRAALDAFLTGDDKAIAAGKNIIEQAGNLRRSPLDEVSEATLFAWCGEAPAARFPVAASVVSAFTFSGDHHPTNWNPIASRLVHSAPDPIAVLREFVSRLRPTMWSGARSTILDTNASMLDKFDTQGSASLAAFIAVQKESLQKDARLELEWETRQDGDRDERFE